ncbi:MAG: replication restart helicase PriA, partial [Nevskiales bacterium]
VGTRSAVFAPLENVGVIIVDEEQDASYKQGETPRYHGRDTAVVRAKLEGALVVLGSATPSLETSYHAANGKYVRLELEKRVAGRPLAEVRIVDMRAEFQETRRPALLSRALAKALVETLAEGGQALVLLNRRGFAHFPHCRKCGATVQCSNCSIALTYHRARERLLCHYCGLARRPLKRCEKCSSEHLYFVGEGAERAEQEVARLLPSARIARLDRDSAQGRRRGEALLRRFERAEIDVLVGTQMIAKGHDFQGVTLVGILAADLLLGLPDFRAAERTFQLLTQAAGRAGRGERPGRVLVQSYYPDHYAIRSAAAQDYDGFYEQELRFRRLMHYPPFTALANVLVRDRQLDHAVRKARQLQGFFQSEAAVRGSSLRVLGPAPAPIARLKRDYRFQFLVKSSDRRALQDLLRAAVAFARDAQIPPGALVMDVDPLSLL